MLAAYAMLIAYKISILFSGVIFAYMGFRLFLADKANPAGELSASASGYGLSLKGGAPGVFFSLFGAGLICFSIAKGVQYEDTAKISGGTQPINMVVPETPPE